MRRNVVCNQSCIFRHNVQVAQRFSQNAYIQLKEQGQYFAGSDVFNLIDVGGSDQLLLSQSLNPMSAVLVLLEGGADMRATVEKRASSGGPRGGWLVGYYCCRRPGSWLVWGSNA